MKNNENTANSINIYKQKFRNKINKIIKQYQNQVIIQKSGQYSNSVRLINGTEFQSNLTKE